MITNKKNRRDPQKVVPMSLLERKSNDGTAIKGRIAEAPDTVSPLLTMIRPYRYRGTDNPAAAKLRAELDEQGVK